MLTPAPLGLNCVIPAHASITQQLPGPGLAALALNAYSSWSVNGVLTATGVNETAGQVDVYGSHAPVVPHTGDPVCLHALIQPAIVTLLQ